VVHGKRIVNTEEDGSPSTALRPRILDEATRSFADIGYARTSMRALAEAAGCTKPALYYHFGSKDALFSEAIRVQSGRYAELLEEAEATPGPVRGRLLAAVTRFFDFVQADPCGLRLLYRSVLFPEGGQPLLDPALIRDVPLQLARALLEEGIEVGEVPADISLDDAVFAFYGMVDERCRRLVFEGVPIADEVPWRIVEFFFNGVAQSA